MMEGENLFPQIVLGYPQGIASSTKKCNLEKKHSTDSNTLQQVNFEDFGDHKLTKIQSFGQGN